MNDLEKTLETERKKLISLVKEALRRSGLINGARPLSNSVLLGKVIQKQSCKVDRIIMEIYREGG